MYISKAGNITVNDKDFKSYFTTGTLQYKVNQPLALTENIDNLLKINVYGGGFWTSRSCKACFVESHVRTQRRKQNYLKPEGYSLDPRMVERVEIYKRKRARNFTF